MSINYVSVPHGDLGGAGIDALSSEDSIPEGFAEDLINVEASSQGYLSKRAGYQQLFGQLPTRAISAEFSTLDPTKLRLLLPAHIDLSYVNSATHSRPLVVSGKTSEANSVSSSNIVAVWNFSDKKDILQVNGDTFYSPNHGFFSGQYVTINYYPGGSYPLPADGYPPFDASTVYVIRGQDGNNFRLNLLGGSTMQTLTSGSNLYVTLTWLSNSLIPTTGPTSYGTSPSVGTPIKISCTGTYPAGLDPANFSGINPVLYVTQRTQQSFRVGTSRPRAASLNPDTNVFTSPNHGFNLATTLVMHADTYPSCATAVGPDTYFQLIPIDENTFKLKFLGGTEADFTTSGSNVWITQGLPINLNTSGTGTLSYTPTSGDFSNQGNQTHYYSSFKADIRRLIKTGESVNVVQQMEHGLTSPFMQVGVARSTDDRLLSNTQMWAGGYLAGGVATAPGVTIDAATNDITVRQTNNTGSILKEFIYWKEKNAVPGSVFISPMPTGNVLNDFGSVRPSTTSEFIIGPTGTINHNLLSPKIQVVAYEVVNNTYRNFQPDSVKIDAYNNVRISIINNTANYRQVFFILTDVESGRALENVSLNAGTSTIQITDSPSPFIFSTCFYNTVVNGQPGKAQIIPQSVNYDATTKTVVLTFSSASARTVHVYWEPVSVSINRLTLDTQIPFSADFVDTSPQLTVWGLDQSKLYGAEAGDRAGWVNHLDSYKSAGIELLVSGLGGALYKGSAAGTGDRSNYLIPTFYPNLRRKINGTKNIGPLFTNYGSITDPTNRSDGVIGGTGWGEGFAPISSIQYSDNYVPLVGGSTSRTVTVDTGTNRLLTANPFAAGTAIKLTFTGTLPSELYSQDNNQPTFYVRSVTPGVGFTISNTPTGSVISLPKLGQGTLTAYPVRGRVLVTLTDPNLAVSSGLYIYKGKDRLFMQQMSNSIHAGSWVIDDYQINLTNKTVKFWVINTEIANLVKANPEFITATGGPATLWDCTTGGNCGMFSGVLTLTNTPTPVSDGMDLVVGDQIVYDTIRDKNPVKIVDTMDNRIVIDGVTQKAQFEQDSTLLITRTSNILPLRDTAWNPTTTSLVTNDNIQISAYERQFKVKSINTLNKQFLQKISGDGATATVTLFPEYSTDSLAVGDSLLIAQAGEYSGVVTILSIPDQNTFTFESTNTSTCGPFADVSAMTGLVANPVTDLFTFTSSSLTNSYLPVQIDATVMPKVSTDPGAADAFDSSKVYYIQFVPASSSFYLAKTPLSGPIAFATAGSGLTIRRILDYKGPVLVGNTIAIDESISVSDTINSTNSIQVPGRWLPLDAPDHVASSAPSSYSRYFTNSAYDNQKILRSTEVNDSLFLTNNEDRPVKFDGDSIYRPGLPRWQPQLFFNQSTNPATYDKVQGKIALIKTTISITGWSRNYFTVAPADVVAFPVGTRIRRSGDTASTYTVIGTKGGGASDVSHQIIVDQTIQGTFVSGSSETLTNISTFSYYFRLNAVDANDNIVASAATGSQDCTIVATSDFQNRIRLVGLPAFDVYDYDRLEVQIYRTKQNGVAPYYLLTTIPIPFGDNSGYIDWVDTKSDDLIAGTSQLDPVNTALKGQELGLNWTPPMRSKHITSAANRLVLGNLTSDPYIDVEFRDIGSTIASSDLANNRYLIRKSNTDTGVVTDMVNRVGFRFTNSITATVSNITAIAGGFQVTTGASAHNLNEGGWAYLARTSPVWGSLPQDRDGFTSGTFNFNTVSYLNGGFYLKENQPVKVKITQGIGPFTSPALVSGQTYYATNVVASSFNLKTSPTGPTLTEAALTANVLTAVPSASATMSVTPSTTNSSFTTASAHNLAVGDAVTMTATTFPGTDVGVTVSVATPSVFTSTSAHGFVDSQRIRFTATTYPAGTPALAPDTDYYVKVLSPTTFNILQAVGGAGLGFTTAGSGVFAKPTSTAPFQAGVTYYVKEVINSTTFTLSDSVGGALKTFFTAGTGVFITAPKLQDALILASPVSFPINAPIQFTGGTPPAPLIVGATYYVNSVNGNTIKLSASASGTVIPLTGTGNGTIITRNVYTIEFSTDNPNPAFSGWWQVKEKTGTNSFTVDWPGRPDAGTFSPGEAPLSLITAYNSTFDSLNGILSSTLDVPVYLGTDYNYQVSNGQPSSTGTGIENLATRRLAAAIDATQRMTNPLCPSIYASYTHTFVVPLSMGYWQGDINSSAYGNRERGNVLNTGATGISFDKIEVLLARTGASNYPQDTKLVAVIRKGTQNTDAINLIATSKPILMMSIPQNEFTYVPTWMKFQFTAPVVLDANTDYCIGIEIVDSALYYLTNPLQFYYKEGNISGITPFNKSYRALVQGNTYTIYTYTRDVFCMKIYAYPSAGYANFSPWIVGNAGGEFAEGQLVLSQPMNQTSTFELVLPDQLGQSSTPSYSVFANGIQRGAGSQIQAREDLHPSRIVASYANFPEIFDAPFSTVDSQSDSAIDINPSDGQEITACIPFFGSSAFGAALKDAVVVVFKTNSIYVVNLAAKAAGQNAVQKIESQGLGCTAPNSVSVVRDGIIFANDSGIFKLKTDLSVYYIGRHLQNQWRSEINNNLLDLAFGHNWAFGGQYKLSVPSKSATKPDRAYVYNSTREYVLDGNTTNASREGSWVRHDGFSAIGWCNLDADSFYANTGGQVLLLRRTGEVTDFRDDEGPIKMEALLRSMDFGDDGIRKTVPYALITYRNPPAQGDRTGTVVQYTTDMQDVFDTADVTVLANRIDMQGTNDLGGPRIITLRYSFGNKRGIRFQLKVLNYAKDENVELTRIRYSVSGLNNKGILQAARSPKTVE